MDAILVAHDGSELADQAIGIAAELAGPAATRVVLLHARPPGSARGADGSSEPPADPAEAALAAAAARLTDAGCPVQRCCARGRPATAIVDEAVAARVELVVMATHARGELGRLLHGSVADEVVRRSPLPVLLVPPDATGPDEGARPEVVVALDGSKVAEAALQPAGRLADALGAGLFLLVAVAPARESFYYVECDRELATGQSYLDIVAERVRRDGRPVRAEARVGRPAEIIAAAGRAPGVRAVAMATHGRGGLARFLLGSTTVATVHQARVPILVVPAAA